MMMKKMVEKTMMSNPSTKPFDQDLHDKADTAAIATLQQLLQGTKYSIQQHPQKDELNDRGNKYGLMGIDVAIIKDLETIYRYADVEWKKDWYGSRYPFPTVHFLERKIKYASEGTYAKKFFNGIPAVWILFNHDFSHHLLMRIESAVDCPLIKISTREGTENESFRDVPLNRVKIDSLNRLEKNI